MNLIWKYQFTLVALLVLFSTAAISQTPIGGVISNNTTLDLSASPYVVTSNILVTNGTTLTIDPGVEVRFMDSLYLQIEGTIRAIGTSQSPIVFHLDPSENLGWGGIRIMNAATDYDSITGGGCVISYVKIAESVTIPISLFFSSATIHCIQSSPLLDHIDVSCCTGGGLYFDQSSAILRNSIIHDNGYFSVYVNPYFPVDINRSVTVRDNHFYNINFQNVQGGILLDLLGPCTIIGNCIENVQADMAIRMRVNRITVSGNSITNCTGVAIGLMGGTDTTQVITGNEFNNNRIHLVFPSCVRYPVITGNNMNAFVQRAVVCTTYYYPFLPDDCPQTSNSSFVYNMQGNYWGALTTPVLIGGAIQDFDDNFQNLIDVDYSNPLQSPVPVSVAAVCSNIGINCSTLTAPDLLSSLQIKLWPNPVEGGVFNVEMGQVDYYSYSIMSADGRCVAQDESTSQTNSFSVNISQLPAGCYTLLVTGTTGYLSHRAFVITK